MVDLLAAARVQLRLHADRPRPRCLDRHEEARLRRGRWAATGRSTCPRNTSAGVVLVGIGYGLRRRDDLVRVVAGRRDPSSPSWSRRSVIRSTTIAMSTIPADEGRRDRGNTHAGAGRQRVSFYGRPGFLSPATTTRSIEKSSMTRSFETDEEVHFFVAEEEGHAEGGTMLGFWLYLMSDCLIFSTLFACYAVLRAAVLRRRPLGPNDLFDLSDRGAQHRDAVALVDHLRLRYARRWRRDSPRDHAHLAGSS